MTDIYVPQRVGEGYFVDWQAPVAGDDLVAWAWDNTAGKYVPQVAPKITSFANAAHTHQNAAGGAQLDHGLAMSAASLLDDDHAGYLLASGARTGATSQAQTFTNGIIAPSWKPASDSATAMRLQNAAGTAVVTVDTTNQRLGIGITPNHQFHVFATQINTSSALVQSRIYSLWSPVALATSGAVSGLQVVVDTGGSNNLGDIVGVTGTAYHFGTGTLANVYGLNYGFGSRTASSPVTSATGVFIQGWATGAVGTMRSVWIRTPQTPGNIATLHGIFIENQAGASSANYAIYTNTGLVRFGDNVGIGNDPTAALDLAASTAARASLRIRVGVAPTTPNEGDIWQDGTDIKIFIGGVTKTFTLV